MIRYFVPLKAGNRVIVMKSNYCMYRQMINPHEHHPLLCHCICVSTATAKEFMKHIKPSVPVENL